MYAAAVYAVIARPLSLNTPFQPRATEVSLCTVALGEATAMGGPAGTPEAGSLVFHTESAVSAEFRALTVQVTATPLSNDQPSVPVLTVQVPPPHTDGLTSPENPPTASVYLSTAEPPEGVTTSFQVSCSPWSSGAEDSTLGAGGMTSDQILSLSVTASESPIAFVATTVTITALAGPLPAVGIEHVVPVQFVVSTTVLPCVEVTR